MKLLDALSLFYMISYFAMQIVHSEILPEAGYSLVALGCLFWFEYRIIMAYHLPGKKRK